MGENQTLGRPAASPGTKTAFWINALGGVASALTGIEGILPPQYAWIGSAIMFANMAAHGLTGNSGKNMIPG